MALRIVCVCEWWGFCLSAFFVICHSVSRSFALCASSFVILRAYLHFFIIYTFPNAEPKGSSALEFLSSLLAPRLSPFSLYSFYWFAFKDFGFFLRGCKHCWHLAGVKCLLLLAITRNRREPKMTTIKMTTEFSS